MLDDLRVRSSPHIDLKAPADLAPEQWAPFRELADDPDVYGFFVPRPPLAMNLLSVGRETAELFQKLSTTSRLDESNDEFRDGLIDLVLDGVLEIESGDDFVYGADALPILCDAPEEPAAVDAVARLSRDALLYAQDLAAGDFITQSMALYFYNRVPLSPFWKKRFPDAEAVLSHLGAEKGVLGTLLDRHWVMGHRASGWISWSSKIEFRRGKDDLTYKLYVSPRPERIREAFEIVVRVLSDFSETPFKIGHNAAGLLRPDKLVAYFLDRETLDEVAALLARELAGCEAHGVPFSAGLDDSGLLSWGVDPPDSDVALHWRGRESWRLWVAKRLGSAMAMARASRRSSVEPWQFALARARRHGIDTNTWAPSATLWRPAP
jgi:hypothetical protein